MANPYPIEFLQQIPKTDLHLHLDGSLRIPTLIDMAKRMKVKLPAYSEKGLKQKVFKESYKNLPEYLTGFQYTVAVLQTAEHLERAAFELAEDNINEGVRYVEVRFAPQLHCHDDLSIDEVVRAVCRGMDKAKAEHNQRLKNKTEDIAFEYGIILCALRRFNPHMSEYYRNLHDVMSYAPEKTMFSTASLELARVTADLAHKQGLPVVGFDLAGEESGYPALDHKEAFQYAHKHFMYKTVHAGEAYGPESIFQAITDCYANRIGHGTFMFSAKEIQDPAIKNRRAYIRNLVEYIANRRITIEVNLTSNLQTIPSIKSYRSHPLKDMLEYGLSVTLCTDNRLHSWTTVTQELERAANHLHITPKQLKNIVVAGFKGSFYPGTYKSKRRFVRKVINRYEKLAATFGIG